MIRLLSIIAAAAIIIQCRSSTNEPASTLTITDIHLFDSVPSGSGMAIKGDSLYIISDDAPSVFSIRINDIHLQRIYIDSLPINEYRIAKELKPDFESATVGNYKGSSSVMGFGSGSKSPGRDKLLILSSPRQVTVSLTELYKSIRDKTNTTPADWNIEGAAIIADSLMLLNRGNNMIILLSFKAFSDYISLPGSAIPEINYYRLKLPSIQNHEARVSGACRVSDSMVLLSASVEDTPDSYSDGPVLGSYFLLLNIKNRSIVTQNLLTDSSGNVLKEKIESVELYKTMDDGTLDIFAISDNDDGKTKMFRLKLRKNI